ncbi:alpha-1,4-glucan--maltose-1-phosphate maltosyltransferase [Actinoallomurus purpureus]|uniref:alpha-1,4-glucan--maltose-1-phosphate maltosyltransferase n=1 Tax=Actinoallomurus purpureus TaxID=478114 RepID=UPI0020925F91|nr:alpha-1,4-glucan--maltose-1-phosphate maltosyltransferase [Actinoallomurus purpureus]MCO6007551.1 alpha-1,4-glucan--maltose-1-phosphate maltosyltransferase [Actinoallomurus purpureus]
MIGRIPILDVQPVIDCGHWPAKAVPDEDFEVGATVFREGHEQLGAGVVLRDPEGRAGPLVRMSEVTPGTDRHTARVAATTTGLWHFRVEAWGDPIAHWHHDAAIKIPRGQDTELMLEEGARLFERAAAGLPKKTAGVPKKRAVLTTLARTLRDRTIPPMARFEAADAPEVREVLDAHPLRDHVTTSAWHPLVVQRERALFGSWYEFFPRSEGATYDPMGRRAPQSGTFRTAMKRLPAIAEMAFDVVYLPPIHPIGRQFRKGPNNTLHAEPHDPGSPWAIGSEEGGHDAVHPELGTIDDFDAFVARTRELGMEVALDLALQCSPDHPWVAKHPEWFTTRADGTIAFAENPPKKYQDIYPVNFDNDPEGIYEEVERVVRHWMDHGVRIFRVDNPHTKPVAFWERLLASIAATDPDVLFLAEAFTRPAMMHTLGKIGFHQSYTYFTWRNSKDELEEYLRELSGGAAAYMRPNFFVNTPDILHEYLQHGGPPAFRIRAVLASTLSPTWGVYSGYELYENTPVRPGSEEYRDSEKFQYRPRDWEAAEREGRSLAPFIGKLNSLRRTHLALRRLRNLRFHHVDQPELICYSKRVSDSPDRLGDVVLVVVNLNPHQVREATVHLDLPALGLDWEDEFVVTDELSGESYPWRQANYVRLDPHTRPAHIFTVSRGES